jgi:hypothetical protein
MLEYLFRLGGFFFGQSHGDDSVLIIRRNFLRVHGTGNAEAPHETAVTPLAFERERAVLCPEVDILEPDIRRLQKD